MGYMSISEFDPIKIKRSSKKKKSSLKKKNESISNNDFLSALKRKSRKSTKKKSLYERNPFNNNNNNNYAFNGTNLLAFNKTSNKNIAADPFSTFRAKSNNTLTSKPRIKINRNNMSLIPNKKQNNSIINDVKSEN